LATDTAHLPFDPAQPRRVGSAALDHLRAHARPPRRWVLATILLLAACCNFYALQREGYANLYYAAAIRSMLASWHNFFFVSFDPGGFVTVDKPPLGFWIQAASAKLLGYSGFSILLPEALAGVASVGVLYVLVRRVFGTAAGLLAALFLAITPISVVTNRDNTIDSLLVLTVLLGAYAVSRAAERGSLRWLLLAAVLVGLGFNIKMLEAYLVVPAFAAIYLLGAPLRWRTRLWHLAVAGAAMLAISLSWVLAVDLTPASARPYVGSSGTNSELELALGYNGLQRLLGSFFNATRAASGGGSAAVAAGQGGPGGLTENGAQGIFRLLNAQLGGQASWLLALGLVGVLAAGWGFRPRGFLHALPQRVRAWRSSAEVRRAAQLSPQQSALVLWGLWTLTMAVFFSVAGFFHRYYLSMLAPGIAALAAIGVVLMWRDYRASNGWRGWLLPAALVVTALTQAVILADYTGWNAWMTPLIVGGSLVAAGVLVWHRLATDRLLTPSPFAAADRAALVPMSEGAPFVDADMPALATGAEAWDPAGETNRPLAAEWRPALQRVAARLPRRVYTPVLAAALGVALLLVGPATWVGVSLASGGGGTLPAAGPSAGVALGGGRFAGGSRRFPEGFPAAFGGLPNGGRGDAFRGGFPSAPPEGAPDGAGGFGGPGARSGANGDGLQVNSSLAAYLEAHQGSAKYLFATLNSQAAAPYIIATGKPVMALGGFSGSDKILTLAELKTLIREGQVKYFLLSGRGGSFGGSGNSQLVQWIEANCSQVASNAYGGSSAAGDFGGGSLYACTSATISAANS
jgi:4-amino-4-deoxy-L-arabinose transferase-like glycosyltransferase